MIFTTYFLALSLTFLDPFWLLVVYPPHPFLVLWLGLQMWARNVLDYHNLGVTTLTHRIVNRHRIFKLPLVLSVRVDFPFGYFWFYQGQVSKIVAATAAAAAIGLVFTCQNYSCMHWAWTICFWRRKHPDQSALPRTADQKVPWHSFSAELALPPCRDGLCSRTACPALALAPWFCWPP